MTPAAEACELDTPVRQRARYAVRGLRSAGFGIVIAICLTLAFGYPLWSTLAHSVSIALMCWVTIDTSRLLVTRWVHRHAPPGSPESLKRWPG